MNKLLKINIFIITIFFVLIITVTNLVIFYLYTPGPLKKAITITINKNTSINKVSTILYDQNAIKYPKLFTIISTLFSYYNPLKSGEYLLTEYSSAYQIIKQLSNGKSIIHKFFVPEGVTVHEICTKLTEEEKLTGSLNCNITEGYLMPSTYFFSYGDQRQKLLEKMMNNMSAILDELTLQLTPNFPLKSKEEILILASIVEKEASNNKEKSKIAGVFINRLNQNMKLQSDVTVIYALTNGKKKFSRALTKTDLTIKSPYNTYYVKGLPITPITCPGRKSLESVINYEKTSALYFITNEIEGETYFSNTFAEHVNYNNKQKKRKNAINNNKKP